MLITFNKLKKRLKRKGSVGPVPGSKLDLLRSFSQQRVLIILINCFHGAILTSHITKRGC